MNVVREVVLTCSVCGTEGPHELLYLSGAVAASRCAAYGTRLAFLPDLRMRYAEDIAVRAAEIRRGGGDPPSALAPLARKGAPQTVQTPELAF